MKKWLLVLGMITCIFGLSACAGKEEAAPLMSEDEAKTMGEQIVESINQYVLMQAQDQVSDPVLVNAMKSWETAAEDMGSYEEIISTESELDDKDGVINVRVKGSVREAIVEIVIDNQMISSITTNVEYTFGEKMNKAVLNTLLGVGTVFCVLILISLLISCFVFIPKAQAAFQAKFSKNKAPVEEPKQKAVANAAVQAAAEEELSDDTELVAVIAAAIAASEGASSADGFVVRSIRRAGSKWQRA